MDDQTKLLARVAALEAAMRAVGPAAHPQGLDPARVYIHPDEFNLPTGADADEFKTFVEMRMAQLLRGR